jgi:hypothetical protein
MARGLKLGIGIPLAIIGLMLTIVGLVLLAVVGVDGRYTSPALAATTDGNAVLFDAIFVEGDLPVSGSFATTLGTEVTSDRGAVFVGLGPTDEVARYLADVPVALAVELHLPDGRLTTRPVAGDRTPEPPGAQDFWVAQAEGSGPLGVEWTLDRGDWTLVVMNADGSAGIDARGTATVHLPALGTATIVALILGIPGVVAGVALIVSALRSRADERSPVAAARPPGTAPSAVAAQPPHATPGRSNPSPSGEAPPPPRPDGPGPPRGSA